jgi:hypothetical protein
MLLLNLSLGMKIKIERLLSTKDAFGFHDVNGKYSVYEIQKEMRKWLQPFGEDV